MVWRLLAVIDVMGRPGLAVWSLFQLRSVLADDGFVRCAWVWRLRVDGGGCAISLNQEPNLGPRLTWDVVCADDDWGCEHHRGGQCEALDGAWRDRH